MHCSRSSRSCSVLALPWITPHRLLAILAHRADGELSVSRDIMACGLTVKMSRDPDTDARISGIASIEEVSRAGAEWGVSARLNGDQSNQGRQLTMDSREIRTYRVRLYSAPQ